jgi:hypothetical protein
MEGSESTTLNHDGGRGIGKHSATREVYFIPHHHQQKPDC